MPPVYIIGEDNKNREQIRLILKKHSYLVFSDRTKGDFFKRNPRPTTGCVVCFNDSKPPHCLELFIRLNKEKILLPVIGFASDLTEKTIAQDLPNGSLTLLPFPYEEQELVLAVREALEQKAIQVAQQEQDSKQNSQFNLLSEEELSIVELIISGVSNKMIALQLDVSTRTVDRRKRAIFDTLEVDSSTELTKHYIQWTQHINSHS